MLCGDFAGPVVKFWCHSYVRQVIKNTLITFLLSDEIFVRHCGLDTFLVHSTVVNFKLILKEIHFKKLLGLRVMFYYKRHLIIANDIEIRYIGQPFSECDAYTLSKPHRAKRHVRGSRVWPSVLGISLLH